MPVPAWAEMMKLRQRGTLKIALYKDFAPFSELGGPQMRGLDVDLGAALAAQLGLKPEFLPFDAGENMSDDLRNMVWRGHYLGYGPADLMLHVPVDRRLMLANDRAWIFAPYHRERVVLLHDRQRLPNVDNIQALQGHALAAEQGGIAASALYGADGGILRERVRLYPAGVVAAAAVLSGEVAAALVTRSQAEAAMQNAAVVAQRYGLTELTLGGLPPQGWIIGMAVRSDARELASALEEALHSLRDSGELALLYRRHGVTLTGP